MNKQGVEFFFVQNVVLHVRSPTELPYPPLPPSHPTYRYQTENSVIYK